MKTLKRWWAELITWWRYRKITFKGYSKGKPHIIWFYTIITHDIQRAVNNLRKQNIYVKMIKL